MASIVAKDEPLADRARHQGDDGMHAAAIREVGIGVIRLDARASGQASPSAARRHNAQPRGSQCAREDQSLGRCAAPMT